MRPALLLMLLTPIILPAAAGERRGARRGARRPCPARPCPALPAAAALPLPVEAGPGRTGLGGGSRQRRGCPAPPAAANGDPAGLSRAEGPAAASRSRGQHPPR